MGWALKLLGVALLLTRYFALERIALGVVLPPFLESAWYLVSYPVGLLLLYAGYVLGSTSPKYVQEHDQRRPILYLRSFLDDRKTDLHPDSTLAVLLGVKPHGNLLAPWRYIFMLHPVRILRLVLGIAVDTSEEQLGSYFRRRGPFVAIGKPGEWFATPGAARTYVTNEPWQQTIIDFLAQSQAVVLQPAKTEGIWWEVHRTVTTVEPQRILLCMINFHNHQNDYEAFRLKVEEYLPRPLPRLLAYTDRPAFMYFDRDWTPHLQPLSYHSPLLWPVLGSSADLRYTLQPFFEGPENGKVGPPRIPRKHRGQGVLAMCLYPALALLAYLTHAWLLPPTSPGSLSGQASLAHEKQGERSADRGEYDNALADFNAALKVNPQRAEIYNERGTVYYKKGDLARALADYTEAIRLNPTFALAYGNRGATELDQRNYDRAIADCNQAIRLDPHLGNAYGNRGLAYFQKGVYDRAVTDFTRVLAQSRESSPVYHQLRGIAYGELRQWQQAKADFQQAIRLTPSNWQSWSLLTRLQLQTGDREGYRKTCTAMLERFEQTRNTGIANSVAWVCVLAPRAVADPTRPVELAKKAVGANPRDSSFATTLGAALYRAGRYEEAIQRLDQAITLQGKGGTGLDYVFLAMAHQQLGQTDEARRWLEKAKRWFDTALAKGPAGTLSGSHLFWSQRLELRLLRAEAEALVNSEEAKLREAGDL